MQPPRRRPPAEPAPQQPELALFVPLVTAAQGDGSYLVRPGKPVQWLTPAQFGRAVGIARNTVYDYIGRGELPERFIRYAGEVKILIAAEAVEHFLAHYAARRGLAS